MWKEKNDRPMSDRSWISHLVLMCRLCPHVSSTGRVTYVAYWCICAFTTENNRWKPALDVFLETRVLVSRRPEDKNGSLGHGSWSLGLGLGLEEKVLQFFKTFVVSKARPGILWDNKSSFPLGSHCLREPSALHAHQSQLRRYLTMGLIVRPHS